MLAARALRPVDIASLAAFRIIFGLVMCGGILRFLATGWIETMYVEPRWFFTYPGFSWVTPWSATGMYVHYAALAALALAIAAGFYTRAALALFLIGFTYTQLLDVTNYLNHHYLVILLGGLLLALPAGAAWSVDVLRRPARRRDFIPAWMVWLLRFQVGCVYFFAGLAKAKLDWLGYGQPLNLWLSARTEAPLLGHLFDEPKVALAMSWAGFLFDTTVVFWLSWRRTRRYAFAAVVVFHGLTGYLFNIGMFPIIMSSSALIFFAPDWPRRFVGRFFDRRFGPPPPARAEPFSSPSPPLRWLVLAYVAVQLVLPLRHFVYGGNVLWHERGMRFAWHVMIREKHGAVTFVARFADGRRLEVPPGTYLTWRQEREMGGQPDLILQLAHHIGRDLERRGHKSFSVHAQTRVSLNGRAPAAMIDPEVDLYRSSSAPVLPEPLGPPLVLRPLRSR